MKQSIIFQCPKCGIGMTYDKDEERWVCKKCEIKSKAVRINLNTETQFHTNVNSYKKDIGIENSNKKNESEKKKEEKKKEEKKKEEKKKDSGNNIIDKKRDKKKTDDKDKKRDVKVREYRPNVSTTEFTFTKNIEAKKENLENMSAYICPNCKTQIITDNKTQITFCSFCGNSDITSEQISSEYLPTKVIPFENTKEDAEDAFLKFCKGKPMLPKGFTDEARLEKIVGIYVPFWIFECSSDFVYTATGENSSVWGEDDYDYIKSDLYTIYRKGKVVFKDINLDASEKMDDKIMEALKPYNLDKLVDFEMSHLSGHIAEIFTYGANELFDLMTKKIDLDMEKSILETIKYQNIYESNCQNYFYSEYQSYMLVPVWLLVSTHHNKKYFFAMNGQTGKVVGTLPHSRIKASVWFFIIFILTFLIVFIIGGMAK